jgi:hypothetical protein
MIAISIEFPNKCIDCDLLDAHETHDECFPLASRIKTVNSKPKWCPLTGVPAIHRKPKMKQKRVGWGDVVD